MAKTPTPVTTEEPKVAPEGEGLNTAPATDEGEPEPPEEPSSAYDQAVAFQPDPWDQLPDDPEVRDMYLAINGHLPSFLRRNR